MSVKREQLVAHRGFQAEYPENSLLSVKAAIELGASWIEVDLQCTDDGSVVLYHDPDMQRISGVEGSIHQITAAALPHYRASEPSRLGQAFCHNPIDTLEQLLPLMRAHPEVSFFLELKEESIQRYGVEVCLDNMIKALDGAPSNSLLISFDANAVAMAKQVGFRQTAFVSRDWHTRNDDLKRTMADYLFINHERIACENIVADKPVIAYEVGNIALAKALLQRGCFAVETFEFERLSQEVEAEVDLQVV